MISQDTHPFIPIYQRLANEFTTAIREFKLAPGSRIDSISELQARFSVSRETAKLVLKTLANQGLIVQQPGKGSFVSDLSPHKKIWGVVLPFYSMQYEDLIEKIRSHATAQGREFFHFVDYNSWEEEVRRVGWMIAQRYEVVMVVPTLDESKTAEFYNRLSPQGTFVALLDHTMTGSYFGYVVQSYDLGVTRGMEYLYSKGCKKIAFLRNETWAGRNLIQELMEQTYTTVVAKHSLNSAQCIIDRAADLTSSFVNEQAIDGLFVCDDADAVRAIGSLMQQGVDIPQQVKVVSYGNTALARYFTPSITSIDPHNEEMASIIVSIISSHLAGNNTSLSQYIVQPDLIVRNT